MSDKLQNINTDHLLNEIKQMIEETQTGIAVTVNAGLTLLYWRIGKCINDEILEGDRAEYGKQILATLSQELTAEYGRGFSYSALTRMCKFTPAFPDAKIVATLSQQLSWSHFRGIIPLEEPLKRKFYAEMSRVEKWSVRTLHEKIDSMLYERTAISKKPEELAKQELELLQKEDKLTPDLIFRDPYVLDFLNLKTRTVRTIWNPLYYVNSKNLFLNSALVLRLLQDKNE